MVEAAVILPVVILSVMAVIYILIFLYKEVAAGAEAHVACNAYMGEKTGVSVTKKHVPHNVMISEGTVYARRVYFAEKNISLKKKGIFDSRLKKKIETHTYEVDEKKLIRYTDFLKKR